MQARLCTKIDVTCEGKFLPLSEAVKNMAKKTSNTSAGLCWCEEPIVKMRNLITAFLLNYIAIFLYHVQI